MRALRWDAALAVVGTALAGERAHLTALKAAFQSPWGRYHPRHLSQSHGQLAAPSRTFNLLLHHWFQDRHRVFNVYTIWGMIWVDGLHYSPMAFLLMTAAFRSMDPALEESAAMSGANLWQVVRRITLALSWPAIFATLLILFVRAIESFEVPALLGMPGGVFVFTSAIYEAIHRYPSQIGSPRPTESRCSPSIGRHLFPVPALRVRPRYSTVTGKGFRPRRSTSAAGAT